MQGLFSKKIKAAILSKLMPLRTGIDANRYCLTITVRHQLSKNQLMDQVDDIKPVQTRKSGMELESICVFDFRFINDTWQFHFFCKQYPEVMRFDISNMLAEIAKLDTQHRFQLGVTQENNKIITADYPMETISSFPGMSKQKDLSDEEFRNGALVLDVTSFTRICNAIGLMPNPLAADKLIFSSDRMSGIKSELSHIELSCKNDNEVSNRSHIST